MKAKRGAKKEKVELVVEGNENALRDALIKHIENRHSLEREVCLIVYLKVLCFSSWKAKNDLLYFYVKILSLSRPDS